MLDINKYFMENDSVLAFENPGGSFNLCGSAGESTG